MRYLVLSDMHANCDAFEAVLETVDLDGFDVTLVLGDLVGYGACPNRVVDRVRELPGEVHAIRGNHDKVVAGIESGENFNPAAAEAARWTASELSEENRAFVRDLDRGPVRVDEVVSICHGSPLDEDEYVFSDFDAFQIFSRHEAPLTFFGHTHIPSLFSQRPEGGIDVALLRGRTGSVEIEEDSRYLVNPGSIGQPRDRDPRAAYMVYDSDERMVHWYRVEYAVEKAQERIREAGLPDVLAERLEVGV